MTILPFLGSACESNVYVVCNGLLAQDFVRVGSHRNFVCDVSPDMDSESDVDEDF